MIINESKFFSDTKSQDSWTFILENKISKTFSELFNKNEKSIFISHKHGEQEYVYRLKDLLTEYGFTGYVDWEDDSMPKETSGETAKKIKQEINKASKFILIATNAAIESKWCNWEIGYADTNKYINHIVLFPLLKNEDNYRGEEYLQIYPSLQITSNNLFNNSQYYILYPDGDKKSLKDWLTL
jgi:hypothetical protein